MKKLVGILIIGAFTFVSENTRAQNTVIHGFNELPDTVIYDFNKLIFKIVPLNFIDPFSHHTAQAGFEYRFLPKYAIDFSYGQAFSFDADWVHGYKAKFEIRKYFAPHRNRRVKFYGAIEGFYSQLHYSTSEKFISDTSHYGSDAYWDDYTIRKNVKGISHKFGVVLKFLNRFVFNGYGGIGVRIKDSEHFNRDKPEDDFFWGISSEDILDHARDGEVHHTTLNITIGCSIGYVLMRGKGRYIYRK